VLDFLTMVQGPRRTYRAKRQRNFERCGVNVGKRTSGTKNGCAVSEILGATKAARSDARASQPSHGCLHRTESAQRLSWRGLAVGQNLSNYRRKIINARTRHDDAVAAAVSFLGNAQESPAVILAELNVEMLPFNLQFSRLDDVIHFFLAAPTLPQPIHRMEAKSAGFSQIS
jgi:hypothetical protein